MTASSTSALPLNRTNLHGVWAALILSWDAKGKVREKVLADEVRHYANAKLHGVYTGGTTGEFYAQDDAAYEVITRTVCEAGRDNKIPVQIGCTALSNQTTAGRIRVACAEGTDALQLALPFWLELQDDEVMSFFNACVKAAGDTPIVFYNTGRAKRRLTAPILGKLVHEFPTLIGMKDTGCDPKELQEILAATGAFSIFGGEDSLFTHMPVGGMGCYSSLCGANADLVRNLYELCAQGKWEQAKPLDQSIHALLKAVGPFIDEGLLDSALDRAFRIIGGGTEVELECAGPYRSFTQKQFESLKSHLQANAPEWLSKSNK